MARFNYLVFLTTLFLGATSCTAKESHKEDFREIRVDGLSEEVQISTQAWNFLEFRKGTGDTPPVAPTMSDIAVTLIEKNQGVLKGRRLRISFPKGGGTIDLADYVGPVNGTYYVNFDFGAFHVAKEKKILFQSNVPKTVLDRKNYGADCGTLLDISTKMSELTKGEGLKVNTTGDRDLYVLGGTFLFAANLGSEIQISQVTFTDSKRKGLFCGGQR